MHFVKSIGPFTGAKCDYYLGACCMPYSRCSAVWCYSVLSSAVRCYSVLGSAVQCCAVQRSSFHWCPMLSIGVHWCLWVSSAAQCCSVLFSAVQRCPVLRSATRCYAVQRWPVSPELLPACEIKAESSLGSQNTLFVRELTGNDFTPPSSPL